MNKFNMYDNLLLDDTMNSQKKDDTLKVFYNIIVYTIYSSI